MELGKAVRVRSIPAGAGEPVRFPPPLPRIGVYPRGCGGTGSIPSTVATDRGLSPRVRGNRFDSLHRCHG